MNKKGLSAINFKSTNIVPNSILLAVPDGIGIWQSKFGDLPADLFLKTDTLDFFYLKIVVDEEQVRTL